MQQTGANRVLDLTRLGGERYPQGTDQEIQI